MSDAPVPAPPDRLPAGDLQRLVAARHHDPFALLGPHPRGGAEVVRAWIPGASWVRIDGIDEAMERVPGTDLFEWSGPRDRVPRPYRLRWLDRGGHERCEYDPYAFPPQVADYDLHLFGQGRHLHAYQVLGSHPAEIDGIPGVRFAVWAPQAERVSVVGDFNHWDGRAHPMRSCGGGGVWELFVPGLRPGQLYKYEIRNREHGTVHVKSDPYARRYEVRPRTASIVDDTSHHAWGDAEWLARREHTDWLTRPLAIYEVHLGSWQRAPDGSFLSFRELAHRLVDYVLDMGFTHVELLPVSEHPLDASWGYQTIGYFAVTSRHGGPDDFRYFVDHCHRNGIGVLLDWVPGHFPKDPHGLARFDGSALYEHEDPRLGEQPDWGTLIFNYGRNEVRNFLLASALFWLEEFHIDGLRVDAVASMIYLDYSRPAGEWIPNRYGGNENLEAVEFLRELNSLCHARHPGVLMVAEESTAWPMVSRPVYLGGLGFTMKWNMGWMNDTLEYFRNDPVFRRYHHDKLTFSLLYAFTENFVLPFSHDEVVHGKGSLHYKMPGDEWQRLANLRLLLSYQYTHPGKKLLFMGAEFAQGREWQHDRALEWDLLEFPGHRGVQTLVRDLNGLYRELACLHGQDFSWQGFEWIDCHDSEQSTLSFLRLDGDQFAVVVLNFTPVTRHHYRIGVPRGGAYVERFNSDAAIYGGSNTGNLGSVSAEATPWMGRPYSLTLSLPPLGAIVLLPEG